jgi:signal transduction histidine kinase/ligand-binding sensor domain-containing protein
MSACKRPPYVAFKTRMLNVPRFFLLCFLFSFALNETRALESGRRISQYGHTAWRVQDGLIDSPSAITQTADGYMWIATRSGLVRFDGVSFDLWSPPKGQSLPARGLGFLLGTGDGSLWIGTNGGLSRWKDGQLQTYTKEPGRSGISAIIQDHAGTIWVTRYRIPKGEGPLCRVAGDDLHCYGEDDGIRVRYGLGLTEDSFGNLWMGSTELCSWREGTAAKNYFGDVLGRVPGNGVSDVAAGPSGSVWAALDGVGPQLGVRYYSGGKWTSYAVPGFDGATVRSHTLFVDRNKTLWVGTENKGLYHIHNGVADHYGSADGLSGDSVGSIYEDHEGNLWVATDGGLDMFRDTPVVSFGIREGLSAANFKSVLALRNGDVWIGNAGAVDVLHAGNSSVVSIDHLFHSHDIEAMFEDHAGAVWLGIDGTSGLARYEHDQFHMIKKPEGGSWGGTNASIAAITEDTDHNIWVLANGGSNYPHHLYRVTDQALREEIPLSNVSNPVYLAADHEAGIWIVGRKGTLARLREGRFQIISMGYDESTFTVQGPVVDFDTSLWIPTSLGLFQWKDGRLNVINTDNGLPCSSIFAVVRDNSGALWLSARCGFIKIEASELAKWRKRSDAHLAFTVFDALNGAYPGAGAGFQPVSAKASDGRLWFINGLLAQVIDPGHLYRNETLPPVHIEEIIADHNNYEPREHLRLPPLTRELEIDYTALSFSIPRKVRFRYKLDGGDAHWEDPGGRRQAFYRDLAPGKYRFHVIASNNDGVWNDVGATLDFSISPAWYQTYWFRILCVVCGVLVVWALYRLRVRQIAKTISARFDERLAERTRLARELHDTLLQTIQGSKMVADDALDEPTDPVRMRHAMERLSEWLGQSMQEVRTALNSLRTSTTQRNDLAEGLQRATEDCLAQGSIEVVFTVTGAAREMHPIVRDEVYRIGYEGIRNACLHSHGRRLEVELTYARDLTIRIKDDGVGIDRVVAERGKEGHFGLRGMRERAARIGTSLTLVSSATFGTEITVVVPEDIAFLKVGVTQDR